MRSFEEWLRDTEIEPKYEERTPMEIAYEAGLREGIGDGSKVPCSDGLEPAALAKRFHETYERLAPKLDYKTRHESAVPWHKVPDKNKMLIIAVCEELLKEGI